MTKILYISDLLDRDILGGGELNDAELCLQLQNKKFTVDRKHSHTVTLNDCGEYDFFIVSNFLNLDFEVFKKIKNNLSYIIYEHDHKYVRTRNPAMYKDYKAPDDHIINKDFYENAKMVFCQTSFHRDIITKNISIDNVYNVSGNLWPDDILEFLKTLSTNTKQDKISILQSTTPHKNTQQCVFYCQNKNLEYELVSSGEYRNFLQKLSKNQKFMFLPKTPETLSRVTVEARMLNVSTITNKNVGACYEDWFSLKGNDLIQFMYNKKQEVVNKVIEIIDE